MIWSRPLRPLPVRCEALHLDGSQCSDVASHNFDGRLVCWTHYSAATRGPRSGSRQVQNRHERIPPVEFVQKGAET